MMFSSNKTFLPSIIKFHLPSSSNDEKVTPMRFCGAKTGDVRCLILLNVVKAYTGHSSEGQDIDPLL